MTAHNAPSIRFADGWIRKNFIEINITAQDTSASVEIFLRGLTETEVILLDWPNSFGRSDQLGTRCVTFDIERAPRPLVTVEVRFAGELLSTGNDWYLTALYPKTKLEFEKMFYRRKHRVGHLDTQIFSAMQVVENYRHDVAQESVAAVIAAFRLIDIQDLAELARWRQMALDILLRLESAPRTHTPRTDKDHQIGSLSTVLFLADLALGNYDVMCATLVNYVSRLETLDSQASPSIVLNGCLAILLCGTVKLISGEVNEARRLFLFNHTFYMRFLPLLPPHAIWFHEMSAAHKAVALSLECAERIHRGKKPLDGLLLFRATHRVNSASGIELLEAAFTALCRRLRMQRRTQTEQVGR